MPLYKNEAKGTFFVSRLFSDSPVGVIKNMIIVTGRNVLHFEENILAEENCLRETLIK